MPPTPCSSARSAGRNGRRSPTSIGPRRRCLRLRKELGVFANLRPAICYPALADASSLKRELVDGLDILILRELTGGVYFGEPKEIRDLGNGQKRAIDTQVYDTFEIERISRVAFELARTRQNRVTSMEKNNVMKSGVLWKEVVSEVHAREYPDVKLDHMLADAGGMQLVRAPKQFDVIVTDNLFGDMLSDVAAMLTGSLGMLPSASLGLPDPMTKKRKAFYEPVHGSAPDIAGKGIANPIAMIASFGMCLRYSFGMVREADLLEQAIAAALARGLRTADIWSEGTTKVGTKEMGAAIVEEFRETRRASMTRIYENRGLATRMNVSCVVVAIAFLFGLWELWSAYRAGGSSGTNYLFALFFIGGGVYAAKQLRDSVSDSVVSLDADMATREATHHALAAFFREDDRRALSTASPTGSSR